MSPQGLLGERFLVSPWADIPAFGFGLIFFLAGRMLLAPLASLHLLHRWCSQHPASQPDLAAVSFPLTRKLTLLVALQTQPVLEKSCESLGMPLALPYRGLLYLQSCVGHTVMVSGRVSVMLTVLHSPVCVLIHLSVRQALLLLELFPFKYQKKVLIILNLNYFVFSHSKTWQG